MAVKDHQKHYVGMAGDVPNTVSRYAKVGDRSFIDVVAESGKPILDSEVQLRLDAVNNLERVLRRREALSGWLRGQSHSEALDDYILGTVPSQFQPIGATDGGFPPANVAADGALIDAVMLPRIEAMVAGYPVTVEYTSTSAADYNLIPLQAAKVYDGTAAAFKRTDFVWLEVWLALVAPSPRATGYALVVDASTLAGSTLTINGNVLTAVAAAPGVDDFLVDVGSEANTALNIAAAINNPANSFDGDVLAVATVETVIIKSQVRGVGTAAPPPPTGNFITLAVVPSVPGNIVISGALLAGGEDRPFKPAPDKVYRHGNTQSHMDSWLDDEITDPVLDFETSQRVQLQYRIRTTGSSEGMNFKKHPDGFSNPGPTRILAQGGEAAPVADYPFVPADRVSTDLNTSAVSYDIDDSGLWIAGDGSTSSAQDLLSLDGFVYAIPLCFAFRHNDVSSATPGFRGFDPLNNTNGAPTYEHAGYNGPLGAIPAGASDRPDGEYVDVIERHGLLDLRRHVSLVGVDLASELQHQMQSLLDGNFHTWAIETDSKQTLGGGSGDVATQFLVCNEVGRGSGDGGTPPFSGDTDRGVTIRNFDHVARRFGDQSVVERVVIAFYPGDRPDNVSQGDPATYTHGEVNPGKYIVKTGGGTPVSVENWYTGDVLHLNLDLLDVSTLGGIFQGLDGGGSSAAGHGGPYFTAFAPAGTKITDVLSAFHDDGHYWLVGAGVTAVPQDAQPAVIGGLGTAHLTVAVDANDTPASGGLALTMTGIVITNQGTLYVGGEAITIGPPDIAGGVQATAVVNAVGGGGQVLTITMTNPGSGYTAAPLVTFPASGGVTAIGTATIQGEYRMVGGPDGGGVPVVDGSARRIFLEVEITYPIGVGITDTPDLPVTPDAVVYDGTGAGPGALIENATSQRPSDFDAILAPRFRGGYRETSLEYVANDTVSQSIGQERPGTPIGGVDQETVVSRSSSQLVFPRRLYGASGFYSNQTSVNDLTDLSSSMRVVDESATEFGSSSRQVNLNTGGGGSAIPLSGPGHTLAAIEYFGQDPVPNFGVLGGGYQVSVYFRSNAPQTAGVKEGDITTGGDGVLPTTLRIEPLLMSPNIWTGQTGTGSVDLGFPYVKPLDQIPAFDGTPLTGGSPNQIAGLVKEWFFSATAQVTIDDFDAGTGLLALHPFVQGDVQETLTFGGATNDEKPRKDAEFRAYYPMADPNSYRPTVMSQPLFGAVRHKVFTPFLAKATEDVTGGTGGLLFRKNELLLIVLSRFAELDDDNTVRFIDPVGDNRTCAALYKTRNLLLLVG